MNPMATDHLPQPWRPTTRASRRSSPWPRIVVVWIVVFAAVKLVHHRLVGAVSAGRTAVELPSLSSIPMEIGPWVGKDIPIDQRVLEVAANDAEVSRRYHNKSTGDVVDFLLTLTMRPANMLGHRPTVCYPAHGWVHRSTTTEAIALPHGPALPVLFHQFEQGSDGETLVVANYYILGGEHITDWTKFSAPQWRRPNVEGSEAFYVAQVQIVGMALLPAQVERAHRSAQAFFTQVSPHLAGVLPGYGASTGLESPTGPDAVPLPPKRKDMGP